MSTLTTANVLPESVSRKLAGLRRQVFFWLTAEGVSLLLLVIHGMIAVTLFLDWQLRWDRYQRFIILALCVGALVALVLVRLVRPLLRTISDDALSLRVETHHKQLGQSLISALQFARITNPQEHGISPILMSEAIRQGMQRAEPLDFSRAIDRRFRDRCAVLMIIAALLLGVLVYLFAAGPRLTYLNGTSRNLMGLWFSRNVALSNDRWPQSTEFKIRGVTGNEIWKVRGDDLKLVIYADKGAKPASVRVLMNYDGKAENEEVEIQKQGDNEYVLDRKNVLNEFTFTVRAGVDDESIKYALKLADRPAVKEMTVTVTPPAYTKLLPQEFLGSSGQFDVRTGSQVLIAGETNKKIKAITLKRGEVEITPSPLTVDASGKKFRGVVETKDIASAGYSIHLVDTEGLTSSPPTAFMLSLVRDKAPTVRAKMVGISPQLTSVATIPLLFEAYDDFAVDKLVVVYQKRIRRAQTQGPPPPAFGDPAPATQPQPAAEPADEWSPPIEVPLEQFVKDLGGPSIRGECRITVPSLKVDGAAPAVGDDLRLWIAATDNDTVTGPKTGKCSEFHIRVEADGVVRARLENREMELSTQLASLIRDQETIQTYCKEFAAAIGSLDGVGPQEINDRLRVLAQREKQERLMSDRCLSAARQIEDLGAEWTNNGLLESNSKFTTARMETSIRPLREKLAIELIPQAANQLDAARNPTVDNAFRKTQLEASLATQKTIVAELTEVLRQYKRTWGIQLVINMINEMASDQEKVLKETRRLQESMLKDPAATQPAGKSP